MGRRPVAKKKQPSEYPQLAFRVTMDDKLRLNAMIEDIQAQLNGRRKDGEPFFNKNDVIVTALEKGLKLLKR